MLQVHITFFHHCYIQKLDWLYLQANIILLVRLPHAFSSCCPQKRPVLVYIFPVTVKACWWRHQTFTNHFWIDSAADVCPSRTNRDLFYTFGKIVKITLLLLVNMMLHRKRFSKLTGLLDLSSFSYKFEKLSSLLFMWSSPTRIGSWPRAQKYTRMLVNHCFIKSSVDVEKTASARHNLPCVCLFVC